MAELVTVTGDIDNSALTNVTLLDSADVVSIGNNTSSGTQVFDTLDSLPTSSLNAGQQAFVNANQRLYISNGTGWYNLTFVNRTPTWFTEPDATYEITDSATPLVIVAKATDSDNSDVTLLNQSVGTDSAQYMVNVSNDSSVFTFAPKSADSIGIEVAAGNLTDSNGDFIYTFKWSDGINFVTKAVTIGYSPSSAGPAEGTFYGNRGIYFSGSGASYYTDIDYWDIITPSNASKFGDLDIGYRYYAGGAASNNARALYMGGNADGSTYGDTYAGYGTNEISYITCSTPSNASAFGYLSQNSRISSQGVEGDGTYAVSAGGGSLAPSNQASTDYSRSNMEYVTIDTTGNSTGMGNLTAAREQQSALSNGTTMVVGGGMFMAHSSAGYSNMYVTYNIIDHFVVANFGSASDFGNLLSYTTQLAGAGTGSGDRGLFMGGLDRSSYSGNSYPSSTYSSVIQYITVSTPGNAQDFGDLRGEFAGSQASGDAYTHGCCNGTNAQFVGGYTYRTGSGTNLSEIQNVVMDTLGNATDHGDLTIARYAGGATSGAAA